MLVLEGQRVAGPVRPEPQFDGALIRREVLVAAVLELLSARELEVPAIRKLHCLADDARHELVLGRGQHRRLRLGQRPLRSDQPRRVAKSSHARDIQQLEVRGIGRLHLPRSELALDRDAHLADVLLAGLQGDRAVRPVDRLWPPHEQLQLFRALGDLEEHRRPRREPATTGPEAVGTGQRDLLDVGVQDDELLRPAEVNPVRAWRGFSRQREQQAEAAELRGADVRGAVARLRVRHSLLDLPVHLGGLAVRPENSGRHVPLSGRRQEHLHLNRLPGRLLEDREGVLGREGLRQHRVGRNRLLGLRDQPQRRRHPQRRVHIQVHAAVGQPVQLIGILVADLLGQ